MSARECQSDLVQRERNAALSSRERLALDAHLASCAECRQGRLIAADFQAQNALVASDGARLLRLGELAARQVANKALPARRRAFARPALLLAAACCLLAGSAAARLWHAQSVRVEAQRATAATGPALPAAAARLAPPAAAPLVMAGPEPTPQPSAAASTAPLASPAVASRSLPSSESAAELLHRAADAKLAGNRPLAIELYKKLVATFPASHEAQLSRVSLGRLLADGGYPAAALREYDAYLNGSGSGALIQEALYGKARALAAVGDRTEEARTWQRLLRDFPAGAYAATARRRLLDL